MATTVAKPKQKTAKEKLAEARDKMNAKIDAAIDSYRKYKENLKTAKTIGYDSGTKDYDKLPKGKGVKGAAKSGYGKALSDRAKHEKLATKIASGRTTAKKTTSTAKKTAKKPAKKSVKRK